MKIYACSNVAGEYFKIVAECAEKAGDEFEAVYLFDEQSYRRRSRVTGLRKLPLRFDMYCRYPLLVLCKCLFSAPRDSSFIVTSNTFFMPLLLAWAGRLKRQRVIHWLYDLYPDAMIVAGALKRNQLVAKLVGSIQGQTQRACWGTVYLGEFLADHAEQQWAKAKRRAVIDISADARLFHHKRKALSSAETIVFHYGGQLGHMHDAEAVVQSIQGAWSTPKIKNRARFEFFVSGAQAQSVHDAFAQTEVDVQPVLPSEKWRERIRDFHVGLVTLSPGGTTVCLPSKTYAMMAGGLAILAICPPWGDLGRMILKNQVGWVVSNSPFPTIDVNDEDYLERVMHRRPSSEVAADFLETVEEILANPRLLEEKRQNAFDLMRGPLSADALQRRWRTFLEQG